MFFFSFQYNENLLMVAIRADQELMAEFLVDNDIDVNHTCALIVSNIGSDKYFFQLTIVNSFLPNNFNI